MKKIRYAVIGVNREGIGKKHAQAIIDNPDAELVLVCDNNSQSEKVYDGDKNGIAKESEELGVPYVTDYHDIANNKDIDAVVIATPDYMHRDMVVDLLNSGKDILCEKPMALEREDCVAMIRAAKKNGRKLMVGQICRKNPTFIKAKELVESGEIGELFYVESEYAHDYCDMKSNWRKDPKHPRPIITGGGCHSVDLLRWIAGNPIEVFAYGNHKVLKDWPVDDSTICVMQFPNGVMGKVFASMSVKRRATMRTAFYGSLGTIIIDDYDGGFSVYKDSVIPENRELFGGNAELVAMKLPVQPNTHNCKAEIDEFTDVLMGRAELTVDGVEGGSTVAVCEAIVESCRTGEKVKVNYDFD